MKTPSSVIIRICKDQSFNTWTPRHQQPKKSLLCRLGDFINWLVFGCEIEPFVSLPLNVVITYDWETLLHHWLLEMCWFMSPSGGRHDFSPHFTDDGSEKTCPGLQNQRRAETHCKLPMQEFEDVSSLLSPLRPKRNRNPIPVFNQK